MDWIISFIMRILGYEKRDTSTKREVLGRKRNMELDAENARLREIEVQDARERNREARWMNAGDDNDKKPKYDILRDDFSAPDSD